LKYPKFDTKLGPLAFAWNQNIGNRMEKGNWQNKWMGDMVMGKCEHTQRNYFHIQTKYKHFQGGYGDYNLAMFTHAMEFFLKRANLKKPITKHFVISYSTICW